LVRTSHAEGGRFRKCWWWEIHAGKRLGELAGLPVFSLGAVQYRAGGGEVPRDEYLKVHADLLSRGRWVIDGFGGIASAWERFAAADTLIFIDLPLAIHFRWVTKRLIKAPFVDPVGWPKNSPCGAVP
jgi:hypothetical protein